MMCAWVNEPHLAKYHLIYELMKRNNDNKLLCAVAKMTDASVFVTRYSKRELQPQATRGFCLGGGSWQFPQGR